MKKQKTHIINKYNMQETLCHRPILFLKAEINKDITSDTCKFCIKGLQFQQAGEIYNLTKGMTIDQIEAKLEKLIELDQAGLLN